MVNRDVLSNYGPQHAHRRFDLFISHAAEDKEAIARPLREALSKRGWSVWFDEAEITLGDSLRQKLDEGLRQARFGVVILSPSFFEKRWPQVELDALTQREVVDGQKVILPVWHEVDEAFVAECSPTLVGKYAVPSAAGVHAVVSAIERAIRQPDGSKPSHKDPRGAPVAKPTGKQGNDKQHQTSGKRPRTQKLVGALIGFVIVAYLGAFFTDNRQLIPVFGRPDHHNNGNYTIVHHPKLVYFTGTVAQPTGAWEFAGAKLGHRIRHHDFNTAVSFVGYCIGQATRNSAGAFDERWLLLVDRSVMPNPEVHVARNMRIPLEACPKSHGAIGGPTAIALKVQPGRSQLLLRAKSVDATTVGFSAFDRRNRKWNALGLELKARREFLARTSVTDTVVAMAVACWAPQVPANPPDVSTKPLYALEPLGQKPEQAYEYAIESIGKGALSACSPLTYGPPPRHIRSSHRGATSGSQVTQAPPPVSRAIEPYEEHAAKPEDHTKKTKPVRREVREE